MPWAVAPLGPATSRRRPYALPLHLRHECSSFYGGSPTSPQVGPDDGLGACRPILWESGPGPNGASETRHADPPDVGEPYLSRRRCHVLPAVVPAWKSTPSRR